MTSLDSEVVTPEELFEELNAKLFAWRERNLELEVAQLTEWGCDQEVLAERQNEEKLKYTELCLEAGTLILATINTGAWGVELNVGSERVPSTQVWMSSALSRRRNVDYHFDPTSIEAGTTIDVKSVVEVPSEFSIFRKEVFIGDIGCMQMLRISEVAGVISGDGSLNLVISGPPIRAA